MKKIVVYKSQTGFTRKYGEWIAAKLGCECLPVQEAKTERLENCDLIIYGGNVCAGAVAGLPDMYQRISQMSGKQMVIFGTGATKMEESERIAEMQKRNEELIKTSQIPFFYFLGGINYDKQKFFGKMILKMMKMKESFDLSDETYIEPLLAKVSELEGAL